MTDLLFVAILSVFFVLAALFVRACDRIIGADEETLAATASTPAQVDADPEQVAA